MEPLKRKLDPKMASRVGAQVRRAEKEFEVRYESMDPEEAERCGLKPGEVATLPLWFEWRPFGWGALRQWAEEAMRNKMSQTAALTHVLKKVVVSSNFELEKGDYLAMQPGVMEWALEATGISPRPPDPKASPGSSEDEDSKEPTPTPDSSTTS